MSVVSLLHVFILICFLPVQLSGLF